MRIAVRNIDSKDESQIRQVLAPWIDVQDTTGSYFVPEKALFYAVVKVDILNDLCQNFNAQLRGKLGDKSCIELTPVQFIPLQQNLKLLGDLANDPTYKEYMADPAHWNMRPPPRKKAKKNNHKKSDKNGKGPAPKDKPKEASDKPEHKRKKKPKKKE